MMGVVPVSERAKWAGIVLIVLAGLVHLVESPEYFGFAACCRGDLPPPALEVAPGAADSCVVLRALCD